MYTCQSREYSQERKLARAHLNALPESSSHSVRTSKAEMFGSYPHTKKLATSKQDSKTDVNNMNMHGWAKHYMYNMYAAPMYNVQ